MAGNTNSNSGSNFSIPATSFPSHQLSNGLYVSGRPDQYKDLRTPTMSSTAMPYTGGDIKKSGELGKMFDIPVIDPSKAKKSGPIGSSKQHQQSAHAGSVLSRSHSGPLSSGAPRSAFSTSGPLNNSNISSNISLASKSYSQRSNSGPLSGAGLPTSKSGPLKTSGPLSGGTTPNVLKTSGPLAANLPATGLITSGPLSSTGAPRKKLSGSLEQLGASGRFGRAGSMHSQAVTNISSEALQQSRSATFPRVILWTVIPLFVMGFIAGGFILGTVKNPILLIVVASLFALLVVLLVWNTCWGQRAMLGFISKFPDAQLTNAKDGQVVKVTGVVTCGSVPLESSYQKINRCIYTSTGLYEFRGVDSKPVNDKQRRFTWAPRHVETHVVDFYISDFQSGLRALVKAGYGAQVTPYVEESTVVELSPTTGELSSDFIRWISERNLSREDRIMRLTEGYIKEGSTVTVLGMVQRHENVLMIVPPPEPISTGCQWPKLLLPAALEGLVIRCDETSKADGIPL